MVYFSDLDGVVGEVVVNDIRKVFRFAKESEYFSIIVKELFL